MTYLIYIFALISSVIFSYLGFKLRKQNRANSSLFFLSLIPIILISGFRGSNVGVDNYDYSILFYSINPHNSLLNNIIMFIDHFEPGFITLNHLLAGWANSYIFASIVYASIIWLLIYLSFSKNKDIFYIGIFFFFTTGFLFFTFNGVRQSIALSIIFYSIPFIVEKKYFIFLICITFASLFHFSAILLVSLFVFVRLKKINSSIWLILLISSLLIPSSLLSGIISRFANIFPSYNYYLDSISFENSSGPSYGILFQIMLGFIMLYYYRDVANTRFEIFVFNLFFIGSILYNIFFNNLLINRFLIYFLFFEIYAFAFTINYLLKKEKKLDSLIIVAIFLGVFIYRIYANENGCFPYEIIH